MPCFAGRILLRDRVEAGWVQVGRGRVVASGREDPPERPVATGWIVPAPVNAHTHVGDAFLRNRPGKPATVKELFGPGGWKHEQLRRGGDADQGVQSYVGEMAAVGTAGFIDFREGGLAGVQAVRRLELPVPGKLFGRPIDATRDDEAEGLLAAADGIGLSGLRDLKRRDLERWSEHAHDARKPFAIHVSEDARDDIDHAISLDPALVVHMTCAKPRDLEELGAARIPIVACPRSNGHFGRTPPVPAMLEAGCRVALGTDNGMLQDGDLLAEARLLAQRFPTLETAALLRMATYAGRDMMGLPDPLPAKRGAVADLVVLPPHVLRPQAHKPQLGIPNDLDELGRTKTGAQAP